MENNLEVDRATGEILAAQRLEWSPVIDGLLPPAELEGRKAFASALTRCYTDIGNVKKDGYNSFYKYHYPTADSIFSAAKGTLAKNGLAIIPMIDSIREEPVTLSNGKVETFARVSYRFAIIEATTGYTVTIPWMADALDNLDKGLNKSLTAALKSFLRILLCISDGEQDTDASVADASDERATRAPKPAAQPKTAKTTEKARTPEQEEATRLLAMALPGLYSEDQRERGEAKYLSDQLANAAKALGIRASQAVLILSGESGELTREAIVHGTDTFIAAKTIQGFAGPEVSLTNIIAAAHDNVTTEAGLANWLAQEHA